MVKDDSFFFKSGMQQDIEKITSNWHDLSDADLEKLSDAVEKLAQWVEDKRNKSD